jgi:hypothetical protein
VILRGARRLTRVAFALVGTVCLIPTVLIAREVLARPTPARATVLAILVLGTTGGPVLVSRWDRWSTLTASTRGALVFAAAYVTPFLLALLGRFSRPGDVLTVNLPLAVAVVSLWWAWRGYLLTRNDRGGDGA